MTMTSFYHNPRCSKSRQALALLEEHGIRPDIVLYIDNPPDAKTLKVVLKKLGVSARTLLRKGEDEYKSLGLDNPRLKDAELIDAMCKYPRLIERPVFINGSKAVVGRPPEKVLEIL
ncbi:MAG TPA: arsenate reductase (glutaredoxin) [Pseudomonadales bacterium]|nr:arsenate reductase (glutaredoxin) [Pseudomonadales bacterium]